MNDMAKALSRKVTIYINGKEVESTIKSLTAEMNKLKTQQKGMIIGSEEYIKTSLKIKEIESVLKAQKTAIQSLGEDWENTRKAVADYSTILYGLKVATGKIAGAYDWAKGYVEEAAKMDDAYADVMKTTGLTHDEVLRLNEAFKQMDTRTAREELNKLASEAGKLGITGVDAVASFTAAADKIRVALGEDLGEDATTVIGKMADVYTRSTKELSDAGDDLGAKMLRIGSAINSLGAASSAAEPHMVDFLARLGGMASQAGLSAQQVLGYASALDQSGVSVEKSATAFQNFMAKMMQKPAEFAAIARQGVNEFRQLMETDMDAAIKAVLAGLNEEGGMTKLAPLFKDLQLSGQGVTTMLTTLKGSIDKVNEAQTIANAQMSSGASIEDEFAVKNNTLQAQMEKAKDRFHDTAETLGNALYPAIIGVTNAGSGLMKGFAGWVQLIKAHPALLLTIAGALAAWNKERVLSAALWVRERPAAIAEWWQRRQNHKAILDETAASARLRLERVKSLQQRIKERIAIQESILARRQELIATGQGNQVLRAETTLRRLKIAQTKADTIATEAATAATKASAAALRTIPLMLLITALTTIGTKLWEAWKHSQRFNKEMRETNKAITEQTTEATYLFDRLEKVTKGSTEYYTILNKLNSLYPEIISKYKNEKGELDQVAAARQRVIDKIRQQVVEQRRLDKLGSIAGDFADEQTEALQMMQEYMTRKFGKKKGQSMYEQFASFLPQGFDEKADYAALRKKYEELSGEDMGMMFGWNKMYRALGKYTNAVNEAYSETEKFNDLYSSMGSQGDDPFELAGKSAEQLQTELTAAEKRLAEYEKRKKAGKSQYDATDYIKMYDDEKKHVDALKAAISALNKEKSGGEDGGGSTTASYTTPAESEKERKARERAEAREAKRIADAWEKAQKDAKKMTDKFNLQAESGLQKVKDDVDSKTEEMISRLRETAEEAGESADDLEKNLRAAAEKYKESQVAEYLNKVTAEVDKLKKATAKSEDGERLNKVSQAVENLRQQLNSVDELLKKLKSDLGQADEDSDTYNQLQAEIKRLEAIKKDAVSAAFSSMDFKVENPFKELSQFSLKDNQARAINEVKKKVEEYAEALGDAEAAYRKMAETAKLEGNEDKEKEYEAQADALKEQSDAIDGISKNAEKLAKQNALKETLDAWCDGIERFTDQALSIFSNINTLLDNIADSELQKMERQKESAIENLDEQLEQGLISQEEYEESKKTLEDEYNEKEKEVKLEQWRRQKALDVTQAIIGGALAAVRAYAEGGPYAGPFLAAMVAAATGIQIAAIANQPEPYAKGGYVPRRTVYQAGEAGPEWVASNSLLNDPATAPVIEALEAYQRGNRRALADIPMAQLNMPVVAAAARELGRRSAGAIGAEVASGWNPGAQRVTVEMPGGDEAMRLWRELATYLKDPNNRRAVISRQTMTDFENNENFLRNRARV